MSCFIQEPEFVGQTKDRLATVEAQKLVESSVRDHFDNWLASDSKSATAILDFLILRAEERLRRRQEKETARKSATKGFDCQENSLTAQKAHETVLKYLLLKEIVPGFCKNGKG